MAAGFDIAQSTHPEKMIAFARGQSRYLTVSDLIKAQLESAWEISCLGKNFAVNFVKNNSGTDSPAVLSSPVLLILFAFYGYRGDYHLSVEDDAGFPLLDFRLERKGQIFPRFQRIPPPSAGRATRCHTR